MRSPFPSLALRRCNLPPESKCRTCLEISHALDYGTIIKCRTSRRAGTGSTLQPLPAREILLEGPLRPPLAGAEPIPSPQILARHLLCEAEQLRRAAAAGDDVAISDELMHLAGRCSAAAALLLSHAGGHADRLTSRLLDR